jgi:hypothetical protein
MNYRRYIGLLIGKSDPRSEFLTKIVQDDKMAENGQFLTGILKDSSKSKESFVIPVKCDPAHDLCQELRPGICQSI